MKIKIAFVCIMTMFICCVLGFNSNAYELQPNGNIISSNLFMPGLNNYYYLDHTNGYVEIFEDNPDYQYDWSSEDFLELPSSRSTYMTFSYEEHFSLDSHRYFNIAFYSSESESSFISGLHYRGSQLDDGGVKTFNVPTNANWYRIGVGISSYSSITEFQLMLNLGDTALAYEPYGAVWYSSDNAVSNEKYSDLYVQYLNALDDLDDKTTQYNELQDEYNSLQSSYDTLSQYNLYGWGTYIADIQVNFSDNSYVNYSKADLISKNWLTTNGTLNVFQLSQTSNPNFGLSTIEISFVTIPPNTSSGFPLTLLNISPSGASSTNLSVVIQDDDGNRKTLDLTDNSYINYQSIYPDLSGALVDYISISGSSPDAFSSISLVGNSGFLYDSGYQVGFNSGKQQGIEEGKKEGLEVGKKQGYDSGYQVGYNKGVSEDITSSGFTTLFNSILSYPTTMIKEVFNFEFMGINIANLITFIISIGIVAFVIKHFL